MTPRALPPALGRARPVSRHRQRGLGMGAIMVVLVLIVFFVSLAIKMVPSYVGFWQARKVMDGLPAKSEVVAGGPRLIMNTLAAQLGIEGIRSLSTDDFKLRKGRDGLELFLQYEVRQPVIGNVAVVMAFEHTTVFPKRERD